MGVYIKNMTLDEFSEYGDYCQTLIGTGQAEEIPPHGRLIDGDVAEVIHFTEEDADGKDFYDGILYAADWISKQPTIIEAEEGE